MRDLLIDDVRVRGVGKSTLLQRVKIESMVGIANPRHSSFEA